MSTLREMQNGFGAGRLDPDHVVRHAWASACRFESDLEVFAFLPKAAPRAGQGPLAGIAVGVKDLFDTADMPTAYGTTVFRGHRPAADAAIVRLLRACGATVLGKTVTTEFAHQQPGPTRNPWNLAHTPGGVVERFGGRGRGRHRAACPRHPDHGLRDPAGGLLRHRRFQAHLRPAAS